ncbi:hypothetical protein [Paraburkholderia sp. MM5482-R1]|uniref:hypothetical protein n=1 Tax=unclassified Paraburkholderia TaxID=2615204 RepID=UPI003D1B0C87
MADDHATLEQQLLDIAQAELEPEIPAYRVTDDSRREPVTVIQRFRFLHHFILTDRSAKRDKAISDITACFPARSARIVLDGSMLRCNIERVRKGAMACLQCNPAVSALRQKTVLRERDCPSVFQWRSRRSTRCCPRLAAR